MAAINRYDASLQMFVEPTREPNLRRLTFLRWLAENDRLEHRVFGPTDGEVRDKVTSEGLMSPEGTIKVRVPEGRRRGLER